MKRKKNDDLILRQSKCQILCTDQKCTNVFWLNISNCEKCHAFTKVNAERNIRAMADELQ